MTAEAPRILVVDDELGMREGCRRILAAEGYEVETAADGKAGLETFDRSRNFSGVLVDLKMPGMSGLELIPLLRERDPDLLILVITAHATIETAVEATKRGAYGYIPKPFTPDELLLPVRNGLERRVLAIEARRLREDRESQLLELASERSRSHTIINCMTDGVLVVNREGQVVLKNAAASRIVPAWERLRLPARLADLECPAVADLLADTLAGGREPSIVSKEMPLSPCTFMVNAAPVIDPKAALIGAVAVLRDITALKKLEIAKSTFVSMVAHEIRSPLAAIEGYLNVILSGIAGDDPARDRHMMERCLLRARSLREMVSELINLTAIETGHFTIRRSPIDLAAVAETAVAASRTQAEAKRIALVMECEPPCPESKAGSRGYTVLADQGAIDHVLTNLIDNAIKYTPEGGHVWVAIRRDGMYVTVSIRDDGIGMTRDEQSRAFDEFFRAKNEYTAQVPGTGLGLSLVKRLVDLHNGRITIQSVPKGGSTFSVSLPVLDSEEDPEDD